MTTILSLDTSFKNISVALLKNSIITDIVLKNQSSNSEEILPLIKKILEIKKTKLQEIDAIAFTNGPGRFSGIRMSNNIAQGLSLVHKIPLIHVSTLIVISEFVRKFYFIKEKICVCMKADTKSVYWGLFHYNKKQKWEVCEKEKNITHLDLYQKLKNIDKKIVLIGDIWSKKFILDKDIFIHNKIIYIESPNARDIIPFALSNFIKKNTLHPENSFPNYINSF
ncbi:tRNA (adenosine(37)-N6)-threonylcarbamoyltransferase complex dimerization subunit type 1 TsaB [Buchnera aphidicola (Kurisakia onigurumii)]|uniref:tRNA (adenosine(37)-N6)-threonylcarbamoyltransferase complex dimerization subunit type 1 TsaB n=1 Tax=Buchnera aphidicola TaxID=9 RepID=UPI0031B6929E